MLYGRDDRTQCRGRGAVGSDLVTVSQADRCDGTFGKQCNRRNHGATGSRVRCRENRSDRCAMRRAGYGAMRERSGHNAAKRQLDGMRNGAERRHLERTLASGIAAQNKKAPA